MQWLYGNPANICYEPTFRQSRQLVIGSDVNLLNFVDGDVHILYLYISEKNPEVLWARTNYSS